MSIKTRLIQMTRGQTLSFTETVLDPVTNRPKDLTGAKIYFQMKCDLKSTVPNVQLTNDVAQIAPWRQGVVLQAQSGATIGQYTVTLIPADTSGLVALGHDDPWLYDVWIKEAGGAIYPDIQDSILDLYPQVGTTP